jgi:hypothetical protein
MSCESEQLLLNAVNAPDVWRWFYSCMYVCMYACVRVYVWTHLQTQTCRECVYISCRDFFLIQDGQGVFCRQLRRRVCVHDIRTTAPEQSGGIVSHERGRCDACFVYACACISARTHAHARMWVCIVHIYMYAHDYVHVFTHLLLCARAWCTQDYAEEGSHTCWFHEILKGMMGCINVHVHVHIHVQVHLHMHMHIHTHTHTYAYTYTYT